MFIVHLYLHFLCSCFFSVFTRYTDDLALLTNTPTQVESLLHNLEQAAGGMYFKQKGDISTLSGKPLKLFDLFTYLSSNILSTESDVNIIIGKTWTAIESLSIIWKADLFDEMKWNLIVAVSVLLYGCTT